MASEFAREVGAHIAAEALIKRRQNGQEGSAGVITGTLGGTVDDLFRDPRTVRMYHRGTHRIVAAEVGQWVKLIDALPGRTKLLIQNRGNGAAPNAGNVFYSDKQEVSQTAGLDIPGIRVLPDGHLWDELKPHEGEVWVLCDTVDVRIAITEWAPAAILV